MEVIVLYRFAYTIFSMYIECNCSRNINNYFVVWHLHQIKVATHEHTHTHTYTHLQMVLFMALLRDDSVYHSHLFATNSWNLIKLYLKLCIAYVRLPILKQNYFLFTLSFLWNPYKCEFNVKCHFKIWMNECVCDACMRILFVLYAETLIIYTSMPIAFVLTLQWKQWHDNCKCHHQTVFLSQ